MSDELFESTEVLDEADPIEPEAPESETEEDTNFDDGLNKVFGNEPEPESEVEPVLIAGMTEDELKAKLEKAEKFDELSEKFHKFNRDSNGRIGSLEQTIKELKQTKKQVFTKDSFKKLAEYFDDENIAEMLAEDLSSVQMESGPQVNFDELQSGFDQKLSELSKGFEVKLLSVQHPDWQEIYNGEEFSHWKTTLKPEAQQLIETSWDGATLAKAFTQFKTWKSKKAEIAEQKNKRLENAIPAKGNGSGGQPISEDYFNQGLQKVLKNR